jgi:hypothetical protein
MVLGDIRNTDGAMPIGSRCAAVHSAGRFLVEGSALSAALAAFLFAAVVMLIWRQLGQAEVGDTAIWDYIAQSILRGQVPYRDVIDVKAPGGFYLTALAMWAARALGVRDILGVRILDVVLVGAFSALTFATSYLYFRLRSAAIVASVIPLMSDRFISWTSGGTEPKLLMALFGLASLILIATDRPLLAGLASMLACLFWQPGLLFFGIAFLLFSRYLTSWRDLRALKVLIGAALPLAITVIYFYHARALPDLWTWTIAYTYEVYASPEIIRTLPEGLGHMWRVTTRSLGPGAFIMGAGLVGFIGYLYIRIRITAQRGRAFAESADLYKDALVLAPGVYLVFCLVDFKGGPYLIPLIPFAAIFASWLLVKGCSLQPPFVLSRARTDFQNSVETRQAIAVGAMLVLVLGIAARTGIRGNTGLRDQIRQFGVISDALGPGDKIYVHGTTEILVLLNRPNLNPYVFLDIGKDDYLAARADGGFKSIVDNMEAQEPKIVALSRLSQVRHRTELEEWVQKSYERIPMIGYDVYVRRSDAQSWRARDVRSSAL